MAGRRQLLMPEAFFTHVWSDGQSIAALQTDWQRPKEQVRPCWQSLFIVHVAPGFAVLDPLPQPAKTAADARSAAMTTVRPDNCMFRLRNTLTRCGTL
jgi:hypothetical protein